MHDTNARHEAQPDILDNLARHDSRSGGGAAVPGAGGGAQEGATAADTAPRDDGALMDGALPDGVPPDGAPPDETTAWLSVARQGAEGGLIGQAWADALPQMSEMLGPERVPGMVADQLARVGAAEAALGAISPLFEPGDVTELRALNPAGGPVESRCGDVHNPEDRGKLADFVRGHNGHRNLYFGVNPRNETLRGTSTQGGAEDVVARRTVFVDMDRKDAPDVDPDWSRTRAELEALSPVLIVETGNGFHAHFRIEPQTGDALQTNGGPLGDAEARLGSDPVSDLPRIARLPWTVNLPTNSKRRRGAVPALARPHGPAAGDGHAQTVQTLCTEFEGIADRLSLPGRTTGTGASSGAQGGEKTPWAAPSMDLLRMLLDELPNGGPNESSPFDDYKDWKGVCLSVLGAARAGRLDEGEARDAFLKWTEKWGGDPQQALEDWNLAARADSQPRSGWGKLKKMLEVTNPAGHARVKAAEAKASFPPLAEGDGPRPVQPFKADQLPPRAWLYGRTLYAGYVSMLVAPGGTGKSALTMADAVAMATGRTILPGNKPHHAMPVWYHNGEDDLGEQKRRLAAALKHHGMTHADLGDRLYLTSGRDTPLVLAGQVGADAAINRAAVDWLVEQITDRGIEVLILDPLGAMHTLPENSNEAANLLFGALREVAERSGAAILLVHHTGKAAAQDMDAAGPNAARGASAFVDGSRHVRQMRRASEKDAAKLCIPPKDCWKYVRIDNGKANLAPAGAAYWVKLVNVPLGNCTTDYPHGDHVQTVEAWEPPSASALTTATNKRAVYDAVAAAEPSKRRASERSRGWIGYRVADAMGIDIGQPGMKVEQLSPDQKLARHSVQSLIDAGKTDGWLVCYQVYQPEDGRKVPVYAAADTPPPADATKTMPGSGADTDDAAGGPPA